MDPEVWVSLAGVAIIPFVVSTYRFVQKVNRHETILPRIEDGIDRVEAKVDTLTEVILQRSIGERARARRGEAE